MPVNKNILLRYKILDTLFSSGRAFNFQELLTEVNARLAANDTPSGISERTLFYDLERMKAEVNTGYRAPIVCKDGQYSYSDKSFTLQKAPYSDQEKKTIQDAMHILKQFKGLPHADVIGRIFHSKSVSHEQIDQIVQFEVNHQTKGLEWLAQIFEAIKDKKVLSLNYQPFKDAVHSAVLVHPYLLKEYRNRWFLIGLEEKSQMIRTFALDRIKSIKESFKAFAASDGFNPTLYGDDFIGISVPDGFTTEIIAFTVAVRLEPYLLSNPLHKSQKRLTADTISATFQLTIIPNYELMSELYRFGPDLISVTPENLITRIRAAYGLS